MQSDLEGDDCRDCGSIIPLDRTDIVVKIILISEKLYRGAIPPLTGHLPLPAKGGCYK